ncbi:hypothetical protein M0R45_030749 [Rubus argutus]|uniref:Mitochondrial fission 1 protein n=1 Tax=Rubus argutus TaxID=59490 RepID=A0AAW1WG10_RUBAR
MEEMMNKFFESVGSLFGGGDQIPWCDRDVILGCERERGTAMLQASLANTNSPLHQREKLYLLAVGYYRSSDYSNSRHLVEQCLEIAPDWRQALALKKTVEDQIAKDGFIGIGITASAVGLIAGGIVAALVRR